MALSRHTRFLILLVALVAVVAGALFGAGFAVSDHLHGQAIEEYRQQEKIEDEMQADFSEYRRASAAYMEAERAKDALSGEHSRIAAAQKKEYIEIRAEELEAERRAALQDVRKHMEVSK